MNARGTYRKGLAFTTGNKSWLSFYILGRPVPEGANSQRRCYNWVVSQHFVCMTAAWL